MHKLYMNNYCIFSYMRNVTSIINVNDPFQKIQLSLLSEMYA